MQQLIHAQAMMFGDITENTVQGSNFERTMVRDGDVMLTIDVGGENYVRTRLASGFVSETFAECFG